MPTLLHISDLHRTSDPSLNNDDLLSAVLSDAKRWQQEEIAWPDLIVVSGDLIQGTSADTADADGEIEKQYQEAGDFLTRLADEIVGADLSKVIIVPGNHDVNWSRARSAMEPLSICPGEVATEAYRASSNIRWNWREQRAYEIANRDLYDSRLEHFRNFQSSFYADLNPHPLFFSGSKDLSFFDFPSIGLVVVGFASWYGNDCFCHIGEIDSESLASSRELLETSDAPLAVAVWHHNVEGGPRANDYMDQHVLHRLIDFGFSIGLHGHQHYPGAVPFELRGLGGNSMAVIGAGSIAVGNSELPMGERRQFNIVVINENSETITTHVRGMSPAGVFAQSHRDDFAGSSFIELNLPYSPKRRRDLTSVRYLDDAMTAVSTGRYEEALVLLRRMSRGDPRMRRQIEIEALKRLGRNDELIALLDPPRNADEAMMSVSLLMESGYLDKAEDRIHAAKSLIDKSISDGLLKAITARRMFQ